MFLLVNNHRFIPNFSYYLYNCIIQLLNIRMELVNYDKILNGQRFIFHLFCKQMHLINSEVCSVPYFGWNQDLGGLSTILNFIMTPFARSI